MYRYYHKNKNMDYIGIAAAAAARNRSFAEYFCTITNIAFACTFTCDVCLNIYME